MTTTAPRPRRADDSEDRPAFERVPPQDLDAEQAVLGGMLLSKDAIGDVVEVLDSGEDLYRPAHQTIFAAILRLYGAGEPADPITVAGELTARGELIRVGGAPYLHTLVNAVPTAANAEYYAEIVANRAKVRRLVEAGTRIVQLGYSDGDADDIVDAAGGELHKAIRLREKTTTVAVGARFAGWVDRLEHRQKHGVVLGVPTGFADLDSLTKGLRPGQMIVIAARPAMGKSTLGLDFARGAAIHNGRKTAFFSLEMDEDEILDRLASAEARVGLHHIRDGDPTPDDWQSIARAAPRIAEAPLYIDDSTDSTVTQIKAKCRRLQQTDGLDLVIIDYLQLLTSGGKRYENRQVEVADMSRNIKLMAKELKVPVVVLAQLNRGPEQRSDKIPVVSDLRESGAIEQDADVVILLHREDAYEKESSRAGEADLIVAKHRNGPTATITTAFQGHYSRFVDMAQR
ncbi:replicative DNA helicase [Streptomyces sp. H39-C1]|uniref:replicative DNA helicase n=1 Tax=Streptomyces sp. H39-C1 TaxID=3004355 RepID=UPI0022AFCBA9|nr:replicative DNA helicase [Streptomyces sp. H39-C1]MCZ4103198.1 replicative DNA helicase [Streptomyces sp. H39-C1]